MGLELKIDKDFHTTELKPLTNLDVQTKVHNINIIQLFLIFLEPGEKMEIPNSLFAERS